MNQKRIGGLANNHYNEITQKKEAEAEHSMITATATEMQNNFGRYLSLVMSGHEIIVTKNGNEVGRFIPKSSAVSYLTDSLTGILKEDYDLDTVKEKSMREKYDLTD